MTAGLPVTSQVEMQLLIWNLLRYASRWILNHHRTNLNIAALVNVTSLVSINCQTNPRVCHDLNGETLLSAAKLF